MDRKGKHSALGAMTPTAWYNTLLENVNTVIGSTGKTLASMSLTELYEVLGLAPAAEVVPSMTINTLEVADALGISRNAAYKLVKSDGFPSFRIGTRLIVPRKKFEQWMDAQTETKLAALANQTDEKPVQEPVQEPEDLP